MKGLGGSGFIGSYLTQYQRLIISPEKTKFSQCVKTIKYLKKWYKKVLLLFLLASNNKWLHAKMGVNLAMYIYWDCDHRA